MDGDDLLISSLKDAYGYSVHISYLCFDFMTVCAKHCLAGAVILLTTKPCRTRAYNMEITAQRCLFKSVRPSNLGMVSESDLIPSIFVGFPYCVIGEESC